MYSEEEACRWSSLLSASGAFPNILKEIHCHATVISNDGNILEEAA